MIYNICICTYVYCYEHFSFFDYFHILYKNLLRIKIRDNVQIYAHKYMQTYGRKNESAIIESCRSKHLNVCSTFCSKALPIDTHIYIYIDKVWPISINIPHVYTRYIYTIIYTTIHNMVSA